MSIVSNCWSQIWSKLWRRLCKHYGIKAQFFSAQHPKTDGQTENANKVIKNDLQAYVSYIQDDWVDHLLIAEFLANNHINKSTEMTLFFADNGFHPQTGDEPPHLCQKAGRKAELLAADKIVEQQQKTHLFLQDQLAWAQKEQAGWANQNRQPHPEYKVKNIVYVDARYFNASSMESKLLSLKNAGPWKII